MHIVEFLKEINNKLVSGVAIGSTGIKTPPVTGAKTIDGTASEAFAGASRLDKRHKMVVQNVGEKTIYYGNADVTTTNGFPIPPNTAIVFDFDSDTTVPLYLVSEVENEVRIVEWA